MKKRAVPVLTLFFIMLFAATVHASTWRAKISGGQRFDELNWNIAGSLAGTEPNILSELIWDDLEITQAKASFDYTSDGYVFLKGLFDYGWILDGTNQDSDYLGDDRTLEFSRSNNKADGFVWDASGALGYTYFMRSREVELIPMVGYSYHRQNLEMKDGMQTISRFDLAPPTGPIEGLESVYKATWQGPWVGFDLNFLFNRLALNTGVEFHFADYYAEADWNLREDLAHPKSFEHEADGTGLVFTAGIDYNMTEFTAVSIDANYQDWETAAGIDRTFLANGLVLETKLNEVTWRSYAFMLGLSRRF